MRHNPHAVNAEIVTTSAQLRAPARDICPHDTITIDGKLWTAERLAAMKEPLKVKGDLDLRWFAHPLPTLASIGGSADLDGYPHVLPKLVSIGGTAYLRGYPHALPRLMSIGGTAHLRGYTHALPKLASIGDNADLHGYRHALPLLASIGGSAHLRGCTAFPIIDAGEAYGNDGAIYQWRGIRLTEGWRICAGCRNYSFAEARSHWASNSTAFALVEKIISESVVIDRKIGATR